MVVIIDVIFVDSNGNIPPKLLYFCMKDIGRELLKHFPGVIVLTTPEGTILWVNTAFEKLTGYSLEEVKGKTPKEFLHGPETDLDTVTYMSQQRQLQIPFEANVLNYHKTGEPYWIHLKAIPVFDEETSVLKYWIGTKHLLLSPTEINKEIVILKTMIQNNLTNS